MYMFAIGKPAGTQAGKQHSIILGFVSRQTDRLHEWDPLSCSSILRQPCIAVDRTYSISRLAAQFPSASLLAQSPGLPSRGNLSAELIQLSKAPRQAERCVVIPSLGRAPAARLRNKSTTIQFVPDICLNVIFWNEEEKPITPRLSTTCEPANSIPRFESLLQSSNFHVLCLSARKQVDLHIIHLNTTSDCWVTTLMIWHKWHKITLRYLEHSTSDYIGLRTGSRYVDTDVIVHVARKSEESHYSFCYVSTNEQRYQILTRWTSFISSSESK